MQYQAIETKTISAELKPAYRPKYNRGNLESALSAAARVALATNTTRQIVPTANGWLHLPKVDNPTLGSGYFETDGTTVTKYERV